MVGWGLAAAVGALAGALVIPTTAGLVPSSMQEILVFAFAAAALGGFDSVLGAVVGGHDRRRRRRAHDRVHPHACRASTCSCRSG